MKSTCPPISLKVTLLICLLALFTAAPATSPFTQQPGDLDPTFSGDGKLTDGIIHDNEGANAVAIQADGKTVVVGAIGAYEGANFALARYNTDGSLDTSFDGDGKVITAIGTGVGDFAHSVAIQPDGKIVAAGSSGLAFALIRYNTDGSLDTSFGDGGKVITQIGASGIARSVAIQSDGKIVAAGGEEGFALVRYNTDGSLDTSFGDGGKVITQGGPSGATSVAIRSDGKIVAAGYGSLFGSIGFALVRYNPDGSLDSSFDGDGKVITEIGYTAIANSVAIQFDGKIVAAGYSASYNHFTTDIVLVRYRENGSLDTSFGAGGKVSTSIRTHDRANSIAIQPNGKIVAAGPSFDNPPSDSDFALVRYNSNGSLDTLFDGDGVATTQIGTATQSQNSVQSVAIQSDGRIVAAGMAHNGADSNDFALARFDPNGLLDTSFGGDGAVMTDFGRWASNGLGDVAIQPDGKIVAVGNALARYNSDGSADTSFRGTGRVSVGGYHKAVVLQPDGKIVAVGNALARYNPDGSADTSFAGTGILELIYGHQGKDVAIQSDGKIVIAGSEELYDPSCDCSGYISWLARYETNGTLDLSFGTGGEVTTSISGYAFAESLAIQPDGKIVAAGISWYASTSAWALVRYNSNGSLDTSFDSDGIVTTLIGTGAGANSIIIQSDGKIVASGVSGDGPNSNYDFALVRYNSNGSLDTSFGGDGIVVTSIGPGSDFAQDVALQPDGKIVAAGYSNGNTFSDSDFALVRYNTNGSLDSTFGGGDGITTVDFNNSGDEAMGMALDGQGRAVVVGTSDGASALARFVLDGGASPTPTPTPTPTPSPTPTPAPTPTPTPTLGPPVTITVTNTNDNGAGSLRQAIADAAPGNTIIFSGGVSGGTITLTSGQLVIDKNLTIQGPGASLLSISGNNAPVVLFDINNGVTASLDGMSIRDAGAGIRNGGTLSVNNSSVYGNTRCGIANLGNLTINNSTINENAASYDSFATGQGGGIFNGAGTLIITNSTIANNIARDGGGIYNLGNLFISNSTISGNRTTYDSNGDTQSGGGIWSDGTLTVTNSTISNNSAEWFYGTGGQSYSGGINSNGTETVRNSIIAGNTGCCVTTMVDIIGTIETAGHNLIGDAASSGGIVNGVDGNIVGIDPQLGPLQNNGGPTLTHALRAGSPAIDAGDDCVLTGCVKGDVALPTDQRGKPRNGAVDIGAFERQNSEISSNAPYDYDGDGKSDFSVFRPSNGTWYLGLSESGSMYVQQWGAATDKITPADYDGDGKTDMAVWRPSSGRWYVIRSETATIDQVQFGAAGDTPLPQDFDGDGKADFGIWRPAEGKWYLGLSQSGGMYVLPFGVNGDKPVPADYDGDGKSEIAVWRPSLGRWYVGNIHTGAYATFNWGQDGDMPVAGDFSGDGRSDYTIYRPSNQTWYRVHSGTFQLVQRQWGAPGDTPAPGNFDGDGKMDIAVFRPSEGKWYALTAAGATLTQTFGVDGDIPTESAFIY